MNCCILCMDSGKISRAAREKFRRVHYLALFALQLPRERLLFFTALQTFPLSHTPGTQLAVLSLLAPHREVLKP